jgi:four helix bundle protein
MQNFNNLEVYKKAYELSKNIYKDIETNLNNNRLKGQLFGAITSIPANLAEGAAFDTPAHITHKIRIAIGEANEAEYWLNFCRDTGALDIHRAKVYIDELTSIRKMLFGLLKSVKEDKS